MDLFGSYYGVDWVGTIFTFLSLYFLGNKKWYGFVFETIAAIAWLMFAILSGSIAAVVTDIACVILAVRGIVKWRGEDKI